MLVLILINQIRPIFDFHYTKIQLVRFSATWFYFDDLWQIYSKNHAKLANRPKSQNLNLLFALKKYAEYALLMLLRMFDWIFSDRNPIKRSIPIAKCQTIRSLVTIFFARHLNIILCNYQLPHCMFSNFVLNREYCV